MLSWIIFALTKKQYWRKRCVLSVGPIRFHKNAFTLWLLEILIKKKTFGALRNLRPRVKAFQIVNPCFVWWILFVSKRDVFSDSEITSHYTQTRREFSSNGSVRFKVYQFQSDIPRCFRTVVYEATVLSKQCCQPSSSLTEYCRVDKHQRSIMGRLIESHDKAK